MTRTRTRRLVALAACLAAVGAFMAPAHATYVDNPYGHFAVREIVIVDHTGDARMAAGAQHAAALWNATGANFHLTVQPGVVSTDNSVCYDGTVSGRIHLCMDPYAISMGGYTDFVEFEPGYTQVGPATHFKANLVHMCGQAGPNCYDWNQTSNVNRVLPHEVGHALGLPHQSSPNAGDTCSIMSVTCYSETWSGEDRTTLIALYGHNDGTGTTVAPTTTTTAGPTTTTTAAPTTTTTRPPTTTTTTAPGGTTTTTVDPTCAALAAQYAGYAGNPGAQAAIRQQQVARGCAF